MQFNTFLVIQAVLSLLFVTLFLVSAKAYEEQNMGNFWAWLEGPTGSDAYLLVLWVLATASVVMLAWVPADALASLQGVAAYLSVQPSMLTVGVVGLGVAAWLTFSLGCALFSVAFAGAFLLDVGTSVLRVVRSSEFAST